MGKSFAENNITTNDKPREIYETDLEQIIGTARRIINQTEENKVHFDYIKRNGRHPIFGYINFLARRFLYNLTYTDVSKPDKEGGGGLMSFATADLALWFDGFNPCKMNSESKFGKAVYLNFATDSMLSSYNDRDKIINSFSGLGYGAKSEVDPDWWPDILLLLPFGVGIALEDGCHSALSLSLRGEYKARVNEIYDFTDVVNEWEYQDGILIKSSTGEKKDKCNILPESFFQLTVILFSIGKIMVEHGISWNEYVDANN